MGGRSPAGAFAHHRLDGRAAIGIRSGAVECGPVGGAGTPAAAPPGPRGRGRPDGAGIA